MTIVTLPTNYGSRPQFKFIRKWTWEETLATLRKVPLYGDKMIFPYSECGVTLDQISLSRVVPLAKYALQENIDNMTFVHSELSKFGHDIFSLDGLIEYSINDKRFVLTPPLVEVYQEQSGGKEIWALVDGLHRCLFAQRLNISTISCVVVRNVPKMFPLIAYPVNWSDVSVVTDKSQLVNKRNYKWTEVQQFPDISSISSQPQPATLEACQYFFYRDLSIVGSDGIRN